MRVSVAALKVKVLERLQNEEAELREAQRQFTRDQAAYGGAVVEALREAAERALNGSLPNTRSGWGSTPEELCVPISTRRPTEVADRDVRRIKADLALLEMATDETIAISHDDHFAEYLK